jgi:hypothetical protein
MYKTTIVVLLSLALAGCGTYKLAGRIDPPQGRNRDQQQMDSLVCKDQAQLAVNSAARQTGDFLLGMTIIGAIPAYEMDKAEARKVFTSCMQERGYAVYPVQ